MTIKTKLLLIVSCITLQSFGQNATQKVFTSDIDNFWVAYDSIQTTKDSVQQIQFIKSLYINKGTAGLKAFMMVRSNSAEKWVKLINSSPKFWSSIRANTIAAKEKSDLIETSIRHLKELYPELREAKMYFTVGGLNSGGTTVNNMILIGTEIATGNAGTDVSDLPQNTSRWLASVFKDQSLNNIVPLNIHEYVHTQQKGEPNTLLGMSLREGSCDFITELVMGEPMQNNYIQYGRTHEKELKDQFKQEMYTRYSGNWLYNGSRSTTVADLGYFMGYAICKSYYNHATDKKKAVKEIIELNYSDTSALDKFFVDSKFYDETFDKQALIASFEKNRPRVIAINPLTADSLVDASTKVFDIVFSQPMDPSGYSINLGPKGKDTSPVVGVVGFSEDRKTFSVKVELQPNHDYEFIITDLGFKSAERLPVKTYRVRFKTK